jgi:hypothetical protein
VQAAPSIGMAALLAKLQKEQRDTIRHISQHGTISREDLTKLVGVTGTHKFAGIMIGIQKSAAGSSMKSPIETIYERENGNGPRIYQYKIREAVKDEVKEALSKLK